MSRAVSSRLSVTTFFGFALFFVAAASAGAEEPLLGSAEYQPSPQRPMGWRGDGTGLFPGANPPRTWSRRVAQSAVTDARYQARKPKGDAEPADAQRLELGIVKDWLVVGPFACEDPEKDIEKSFIGDEAAARPDEGDKVGEAAWKSLHSSIDTQSTHYTNEGTCQDYNVDFVFLYGKLENQVAYAHTYIYSPRGGNAQLSIHRSGVAAKIWVNGKPQVLNPKDWSNVHISTIALEKGWNRLLVKLTCAKSTKPEGQNPWISKWLFSAYISPTLPAVYETQNIAWMARLPAFSASSPVVCGDRIFAACGTSDLVCINKADGKVLWLTTLTPCDAAGEQEKAAPGYKENVEPLAGQLKQANEALVKEMNTLGALKGSPQAQQTKVDTLIKQKHDLEKKLHDALRGIDSKKYVPLYVNEVAGTNATPVTDGQRVYAVAGGGSKGPGAYVFAAYTLDGQRVWSYHDSLGASEHGNHLTPALVDGKLIYGVMTKLLAFDAASGKIAWRAELPREADNAVGCTYVPAKIGGTSVLITLTNGTLRVSDGTWIAKPGKESLFPGLTTPVIANGVLYADGVGQRQAYEAAPLPAADGPIKIAHSLAGKQWRMEGSSAYSIASPIVVGGLFYSVDTMGGLTVIDPAEEKVLYMRRLEMYQRANRSIFGFTASPAVGGKSLYIFDNTGCGVVLEPGREYKEVAKNIIENYSPSAWQDYKQELFYAAPVFDGPAMYLKGGEYLYCVRAN